MGHNHVVGSRYSTNRKMTIRVGRAIGGADPDVSAPEGRLVTKSRTMPDTAFRCVPGRDPV
jgi:hypothetical protein